jgi:hypothetical protein
MGRLPRVANTEEFGDGLQYSEFSKHNKRSRIAEECEWPA